MALTYEEQAALMRDIIFVGRVKVAGLHYATYIMGEDPGVQGHSARYRWAQKFAAQPDIEANAITPMVVQDPSVIEDGNDISDTQLQTATEGVVNKFV